jgi:Amt family ammonium transporter
MGVIFLKDRLKIDDALDVSSVHGVAGIIGSLAIGIFASSLINPSGPNGLLYGNAHQLLVQAIGVAVAGSLGFGGTLIIMKVIDVLIGIRVSHETEERGLDIEEHAERAYTDEGEFEKIQI